MTAVLDPTTGLAAEAPPSAGSRRRIAAALWCRRGGCTSAAIVVALVALATLTRTQGLGAQNLSDDEGTYMAQAWAVVHHRALSPYTYWYDHPPLGWLLLAGWDVLSAPFVHPLTAVGSGRVLMVVLAGVDAALIFVAARRLGLSRLAGAAAGALWIFSPLAVGYSRMVFLDSVALPLLLAAFVLALSPRRHLWVYASAGALTAGAVLCKETFALSVPAVLLAVWLRSAGRTRPFCLVAFGGPALLLLGFYPLLALLKGELLPGADHVSLWAALHFQLGGRASGGSPLQAGSASAQQVAQWLTVDPVLLVAGVAAAVLALALPRLRPAALAVVLPVLVSLRPGYLPTPFIIALLPFCALSLVAVVEEAVALAAGRRWHLGVRVLAGLGAVLAVGGVAAPASADWAQGRQMLRAGHAEVDLARSEAYIATRVPRGQRLLVDDTLWVDLVQQGRPEHDVIWLYKTDFANNLDPSVARQLPGGYRDFQWIVSGPVLRSALAQYPGGLETARLALRYSTVVATFGAGAARLEVRQLHIPPGAPAPHIPRS